MWLTIFVLHELGLNVAGYPKKKRLWGRTECSFTSEHISQE